MSKLRPFTIALVCVVLFLAGCGGGDDDGDGAAPPPVYTAHIMSDPAVDGDIEQTSPTTFAVTQGMSPDVQSVFTGIDPVALTEFRAFLNFPLSGPKGVPSD